MSLRARLLAGMAVVAIVLGLAAVMITRTTESHLIAQTDEQLRSAERPFRDFDGRGGGNDPGGPSISSLYGAEVDADGDLRVVVTPNLTGEDAPAPAIDGAQALAAAETGEPFTVGSVGSDLRYRVLARADEHSGSVSVVALPLSGVDQAVTRLIQVEIAATLAVLAVLTLVTWWVVRLGVRPIKRMTAAAATIAAGDLSHRIPAEDHGTEAAELGVALNRMMGHIESAFAQRTESEERLRQFIADASHELRTPVTTIRGYAELYRAGALEDREELREAMRRTEQEATRMGSLVDDLLHLARLDQGRPMDRGPVDLAAVAADAARDARAVDPERPIQAEVADAPSTVVEGDEQRLRQVVANLVGNALVHTPAGTPIEIRVSGDGDRAALEVVDHGPGMTEEVAARAFERFFRADPARTRHRGGSGLGLSIVQATVGAHGGQVSLRARPGEGTTVRVELPIAAHIAAKSR
jgi:two-component system OmpR family sensor kinase